MMQVFVWTVCDQSLARNRDDPCRPPTSQSLAGDPSQKLRSYENQEWKRPISRKQFAAQEPFRNSRSKKCYVHRNDQPIVSIAFLAASTGKKRSHIALTRTKFEQAFDDEPSDENDK